MKKGISTIICTYNRRQYIVQCLNSIAAQTLDKNLYELIVVDNNSTDDTPQLVKKFAADNPNVPLKYVVETEQGLSAARNRGIKEAQFDIVNYTDDDAVMTPQYLETLFNYMSQHPDVMGMGGKIIAHYENKRPNWMSYYLEGTVGATHEGEEIKQMKKGSYPPGNNMTYRKEVFERYGYFDNSIGPNGNQLLRCDEKDIAQAIQQHKEKIVYHPQALIYHYVPDSRLTPDYFRRQSAGLGISESRRLRKYGIWTWIRGLVSYKIKLGASAVLALKYLIAEANPAKAKMIALFRFYAFLGYLGMMNKA